LLDFTNKLTANLNETEFEVVKRNYNIKKIMAEGRAFMRNVSHVKKIPSVPETSLIFLLGSNQFRMTSTQDDQESQGGKEHRVKRSWDRSDSLPTQN